MNLDFQINLYTNLNNSIRNRISLLDNSSKFSTIESSGNVSAISTFSTNGVYGDLTLPLLIKGRLITSGKYSDAALGEFFLPEEELKSTMHDWIKTSGYKHHGIYESIMKGKDVSIDGIASKITKLTWNEEEKGIDFFAEVYDADVAFKILHGLVKYVSAGFARNIKKIDGLNHLVGIEPKEWSFVFVPRDKNAEIHPVI